MYHLLTTDTLVNLIGEDKAKELGYLENKEIGYFKPINDCVSVVPTFKKNVTDSGIILSAKDKEKYEKVEVIDKGPNVSDEVVVGGIYLMAVERLEIKKFEYNGTEIHITHEQYLAGRV
jgi:co-chaperonin GroES (HSP10)